MGGADSKEQTEECQGKAEAPPELPSWPKEKKAKDRDCSRERGKDRDRSRSRAREREPSRDRKGRDRKRERSRSQSPNQRPWHAGRRERQRQKRDGWTPHQGKGWGKGATRELQEIKELMMRQQLMATQATLFPPPSLQQPLPTGPPKRKDVYYYCPVGCRLCFGNPQAPTNESIGLNVRSPNRASELSCITSGVAPLLSFFAMLPHTPPTLGEAPWESYASFAPPLPHILGRSFGGRPLEGHCLICPTLPHNLGRSFGGRPLEGHCLICPPLPQNFEGKFGRRLWE
jgi:hypothetical protein